MFEEVSPRLLRGLAALVVLVILVVAAVTLLSRVAFSTSNTRDALFLVDVGWRLHNGAIPGVDFKHFYGGLTEQFIGWAMTLFGPSIKALDQGVVLIWAAMAAATAAVAFRRLGIWAFVALFAIVSATVLSRAALNDAVALTGTVATYGTLYNRFGAAVGLLILAYCLVPARDPRAEMIGAAVLGVALVAVATIKPTFAILIPAALLALIVQARWIGLGLAVLAAVVSSFFIDPWALRFLGSIAYIQEIGGGNVGPIDLIKKSVKLLIIHPFALTAALMAFLLSARAAGDRFWQWPLAALLVMGATVGMASTMSKVSAIGQQMVPALAAFTILAFVRMPQAAGMARTGVATLAIMSSIAYAGPMLLNTLAVGGVSFQHRNEGLVSAGPMAPFVGVSYNVPLTDRKTGVTKPLEELTQDVALAMQDNVTIDSGMGTVLVADAIGALAKIENITRAGIVAEVYTFSFAMGAPPVLDFPTYQRPSAPELDPANPFSEQIDVVLLTRYGPPNYAGTRANIVAKMGDAFGLCLQSDLWLIYTRGDRDGCVPPPVTDAPPTSQSREEE